MGLSPHGVAIVVMCLLWVLDVTVGSEGRAICEGTGLGKPARVTCHYGLNVAEARDVSVVWLRHDTDGKQETVVECHRHLDKEFDCLPEDGYKTIGTVSDQLVINITRAQAENLGMYSCQVGTQQTAFPVGTCILENKVSNDSTTSTPPSEQENDNPLNGDVCTSGVSAWTIIFSVIFSAVLILILAQSAIFLLVRWRRRCERRLNCWQQEQDEEKHDRANDSLLQPGYGGGPDKKDVRQHSYKLTQVKDSSGGVSISMMRDASPDRSVKEISISAGSNIGDNHDVNANSQSTSEVHSVADKIPCTDDNSQHGDHIIRGVTDPSSKTSSGLESSQSDYLNPYIDTRVICEPLQMELIHRYTHC